MANLDPAPSNRAMWRAYALAPAVTPIAFIAVLAVVGIVLPVPAIAAVILICYVVAGLIGMPIAFALRCMNALNAYTIHGAAFCWGVLSSFACAATMISVAAAIGGTWDTVPLVALNIALIAPPVVLSGTAFWLLLRRNSAAQVGDNSKDSASHASQSTADNHRMQRRTGGTFYCLLASLSPVLADA